MFEPKKRTLNSFYRRRSSCHLSCIFVFCLNVLTTYTPENGNSADRPFLLYFIHELDGGFSSLYTGLGVLRKDWS